MGVTSIVLIFSTLAVGSFGGFVADLLCHKTTEFDGTWRELSVTLPIPNLRHPTWAIKYGFNDVPQTLTEAKAKKWTVIPGSDCANNGRFSGVRYVPPVYPSIAGLYDSQGVVVGFQMIADKTQILNSKKPNNYKYDSEPFIFTETLNLDGTPREYFVLTAYFVEPSTICSSSRSESNVATEGFGNELYFQNGPTPASLVQAPKTRSEAAEEGWRNNKCLPLNGYHNFYHVDEWQNSNCTIMRPAWLFYDCRGGLSGFGFTLPGRDESARFQNPPGSVVELVIAGYGAKCAGTVAEDLGFSNINVYLNKRIKGPLACV